MGHILFPPWHPMSLGYPKHAVEATCHWHPREVAQVPRLRRWRPRSVPLPACMPELPWVPLLAGNGGNALWRHAGEQCLRGERLGTVTSIPVPRSAARGTDCVPVGSVLLTRRPPLAMLRTKTAEGETRGRERPLVPRLRLGTHYWRGSASCSRQCVRGNAGGACGHCVPRQSLGTNRMARNRACAGRK